MFLAVDKPAGITSFDVIRIIKKHIPHTKIGHSGTLDPMATGLMILALDNDTKHLTELIGKDKSYIATVDFSKSTDTWDMDVWKKITHYKLWIKHGKVGGLEMENGNIEAPTLSEIEKKLQKLIPEYTLPLPAFSAKKRLGKRSYQYAREGKFIEENKIMKINNYEILKYEFPLLQLILSVGSGTYIRSIAYRLGKELGLGGTLVQLRRISIGQININQLQNREELSNIYKGKKELLKFCKIQF